MNIFFHKKKWNVGVVQQHVDPPPTLLIKSKHDDNSEKDIVKLKLHRETISDNPDLYEFKISLFDNGGPEEFLLFIFNFNMTLLASGNLDPTAKPQYLCTIVCGEALHQFDSLYADA